MSPVVFLSELVKDEGCSPGRLALFLDEEPLFCCLQARMCAGAAGFRHVLETRAVCLRRVSDGWQLVGEGGSEHTVAERRVTDVWLVGRGALNFLGWGLISANG